MLFRMSVQHEYADCLALIKVYDRTAGKAPRIVRYLVAALECAAEVYLIVICVKAQTLPPLLLAGMIFIALLLIFILLTPQINAIKLQRQYKKYPPQEISFDEEKVLIRGKRSHGSFDYSYYKSVYHSKNAYYLLSEGRQILDIPERCFVEGDPAAFGAFLAEKTGLEVKELN